jgi:REP element-mobilizing transposase RayT
MGTLQKMKVNFNEQYKTFGRNRASRLSNYDYSEDRPIHVTICTDNKKNIFDSENKAKITIEELLKTSKELGFRILCYCLMPDHLHMVLSPGDSALPLSKFLNVFKGRTSKVFRESERLSKIWQRSAFDHVIRADEDLRAIIEYIRNNPVRKGIAEKADDYPYSKWFDVEIQKYI